MYDFFIFFNRRGREECTEGTERILKKLCGLCAFSVFSAVKTQETFSALT